MSLARSSVFYLSHKLSWENRRVAEPISNSCFGKNGIIKTPILFHNNDVKQKFPCLNKWKTGSLYNGYPCFPSLHHPLETDLQSLEDDLEEEAGCANGGIGIVEFFQGKNILITGGTGLVGKVFIEKLLRSTPVHKIYVLIKADDKQAAVARLHKDIISSELFKVLAEKHGNDYETFIQEKLVPVLGNICETSLGLDSESAQEIMNNVDVIVGSAASTTLNDRYDSLLDINVNATQRLMRFGKTCRNLKLFVHISTAYVNGRKEGIIIEKPLMMGENGLNQDDDFKFSSSPRLDLADEISLAMKWCRSSSSCDETKDLKRLGQERANYFGWCNAYHMTKAMGEMTLQEIRGDTPVLIIRPTVIESSCKEPFAGWIQGNRMFDPVIISHGKGQLPAFLADPDMHMDIIPVDVVVNSTIASIAKHGMTDKSELNVYHVASGIANPLRFSEFFEIIHDYFKSTPLFMSNKIKKIECFDNFKDFSKYTRDEIYRLQNGNGASVNGKCMETRVKVRVAYAEQVCKMYEFIGFYKGRFHTGNLQKLLSEMSKTEQDEFEIDAKKIDWRSYFKYAHIPGLEKHVLSGTRMFKY